MLYCLCKSLSTTWAYICVVSRLEWPSRLARYRIFPLLRKKFVAKLWRKVWGVTRLFMPARMAVLRTRSWMFVAVMRSLCSCDTISAGLLSLRLARYCSIRSLVRLSIKQSRGFRPLPTTVKELSCICPLFSRISSLRRIPLEYIKLTIKAFLTLNAWSIMAVTSRSSKKCWHGWLTLRHWHKPSI